MGFYMVQTTLYTHVCSRTQEAHNPELSDFGSLELHQGWLFGDTINWYMYIRTCTCTCRHRGEWAYACGFLGYHDSGGGVVSRHHLLVDLLIALSPFEVVWIEGSTEHHLQGSGVRGQRSEVKARPL